MSERGDGVANPIKDLKRQPNLVFAVVSSIHRAFAPGVSKRDFRIKPIHNQKHLSPGLGFRGLGFRVYLAAGGAARHLQPSADQKRGRPEAQPPLSLYLSLSPSLSL